MSKNINQAFIIGTGRCGTSWLGQMLNSHIEICVPPEIQLLFEYSENGSRLYEEFLLAGKAGLDGEHLASIIQRGCPHKLEMFFDYPEFCGREDTPKGSLVDFVTAFYSAIAEARGKTWLIEQTPWYGQRLDLVSRFFPSAKIIHMIRDGRDVALSFARTPWWHTSPRLNLARWQREIKKIALDAAHYLDAGSYLEVKYENLVADTDSELRRICDFLGVEFDPAMLDPKGFIDYDQFCNFDMAQASSQAYSAWRQRKDAAVFSENVEAWRRTDNLFHGPLPEEIVYWLSRYGYSVGESDAPGVETLQYHQEYSFAALEPLNLAQSGRIQALEGALARQAEHIGIAEEDWAARGDLITQLAKTIEDQSNQIEEQSSRIEEQSSQIEGQSSQIEGQSRQIEGQSRQIEEQSRQIEGQSRQIEEQSRQIEERSRQIEEQSERIKDLLQQIAMGGGRSTQLEREVVEARLLVENLERELSGFRNSWCGTLIKAVGKFRSQ